MLGRPALTYCPVSSGIGGGSTSLSDSISCDVTVEKIPVFSLNAAISSSARLSEISPAACTLRIAFFRG